MGNLSLDIHSHSQSPSEYEEGRPWATPNSELSMLARHSLPDQANLSILE